MSNIKALSVARHSGQRWRGSPDYSFASKVILANLAAAELAKAALSLPLAFVKHDVGWSLAAVLGLLPGQNLYLNDQGMWLASYIPATFRGYPFLIGSRGTGDPVLCVDEGSGLIGNDLEGEPLFDEAGELSASVRQVWAFLEQTAQSEVILMEACDILAGAGVIEPWPITIQTGHGNHEVTGLHRINEVAFNRLDEANFIALRRQGVLSVAYAQLLSMGNITYLAQLAQARAQHEARARAAQQASVAPPISLPNDSTIDWDWSKIGR